MLPPLKADAIISPHMHCLRSFHALGHGVLLHSEAERVRRPDASGLRVGPGFPVL